MQDGIIAGNGNSRYLKTVSAALSLYPTYQDFMAALVAGTFPIDLNGINKAGWTQQGTALNKANLLADNTATSIGLDGSATVNTAVAKLKSLIDASNVNANTKSKTIFGTYVGTGTSGKSGATTLTFSEPVQLVLIYKSKYRLSDGTYAYGSVYCIFLSSVNISNGTYSSGDYSVISSVAWSNSNKTVTWYSNNDPGAQLNNEGYTYYYVAFA